MSSVDVINTFSYLQFGKKAPSSSGYKGVINTKSIVGYIDYTTRKGSKEKSDEAIKSNGSYLDYTSQREGSTRTYTSSGWLNSDKDIQEFKDAVSGAFNKEGDIVYRVVLSMRDYEDAYKMKHHSVEDYAATLEKILEPWAEKAGFEKDNLVYWMDHHVNTDNPHIHFNFIEKENTRSTGKLPMKYINDFKGKFWNEMFSNAKFLERVGENAESIFKEKDKIFEDIKSNVKEMQFNDSVAQQIQTLAKELPQTGRLSYNSSHMIPYRDSVDAIVDSLLKSDELSMKYQELMDVCKVFDELKSESLNTEYKTIQKQEDKKLRVQIANYILGNLKTSKANVEMPKDLVDGFEHIIEDDGNGIVEISVKDVTEVEENSPIEEEEVSFSYADKLFDKHLENKIKEALEETETRYGYAKRLLAKETKTPEDIEKILYIFKKQGKRGNGYASFHLGKIYEEGKLVDQSDSLAHIHYQNALKLFEANYAKDENGYLAMKIAKMYIDGKGCETNIEHGIEILHAATENGYAQYYLSNLYKYGGVVEKDVVKSTEYLQKTVSVEAIYFADYQYAKLLESGVSDLGGDDDPDFYYKRAMYEMKQIEEPDDKVKYRMASMYAQGKGVEQDIDLAKKLYTEAMEMGNEQAELSLINILLKSEDEMESQQAKVSLRELSLRGNQLASYRMAKLLLEEEQQDAVQIARYLKRSFHQGFDFAAYKAGKIMLENCEGKRDEEEALSYLKFASDTGVGIASYNLAKYYLDGREPDMENGMHYLKLSHSQKCGYATYKLGVVYSDDEFNIKDINEAIKYLSASSFGGNNLASYKLANMYLEEESIKDTKMAITYLEKAIEQGSEIATYKLANVYNDANSSEYSAENAIRYYSQVEGEMEGWAAYKLANIYLNDEKHIDCEKAYTNLMKASDYGIGAASYKLAKMMLEDENYIDTQGAIQQLERAITNGCDYANYRLGKIYVDEQYGVKDPCKAVRYLTVSARLGEEYGMYRLATLLLEEEEVRNVKLAFEILDTLAKEHGSKQAQVRLGFEYLKGELVGRDLDKARHYLSLAEAQGCEFSKELINDIDEGAYDFKETSFAPRARAASLSFMNKVKAEVEKGIEEFLRGRSFDR